MILKLDPYMLNKYFKKICGYFGILLKIKGKILSKIWSKFMMNL